MKRIILKLIALKYKKNKTPEGFTSLEILVALIISLAFVGLSLQAIVTGMMLKVNAQQDQRADQLIQEDIERINDLSAAVASGDGTCNATTYNDGYAKALWDDLAYPDITSGNTPIYKTLSGKPISGSQIGTILGLDVTHVSDGDATKTRTLKIKYQVKPWDNDNDEWETDEDNNQIILAERYIEIIPDVALECP